MSSIELFYEDIKPLKLKKSALKKYINQLVLKELKASGDINVIFCSDAYLINMNKKYLDHDYYTDIITFNYVENNTISGDLFISYERIKENAELYETEVKKEVIRVVFHGILHLVGYNDKTESERKIMKEKENFYLNEVDFEEIKL